MVRSTAIRVKSSGWRTRGWLKWGRLANFVPDDLTALDDWGVEYLVELKHDPDVLRALWERSDLPLPDPPPDK